MAVRPDNRSENRVHIPRWAAALSAGLIGLTLLLASGLSIYQIAAGIKSPEAWLGIAVTVPIGIALTYLAGNIAAGSQV